jgi:multiple sugar transport system substrate-binding protein
VAGVVAMLLATVPRSATPVGADTAVTIYSTQFTPVNEASTFRDVILSHSPASASFQPATDNATFFTQVESQVKSNKVQFNVLAGLQSDFEPLASDGMLQDVTPLLNKLKKRGFPQSFIKLAAMGSKKQHYFIPWITATYVLGVNRKALKYLPKGVKVNKLTYDQLVKWGQNIKKKTGRPMIGFPVAGLIHRFMQGYLYPSYTGGVVRTFKSKAAVKGWTMMKKLWAVSNPQSTSYAFMQDPLLSGEVWIAWDHVARLINAANNAASDMVLVPSPRGPKGLGYMVVLGGLAIPKGAPNKAAAEKVIDYLTQNQQEINILKNLAFFPATKAKIPATLPTGTWTESLAVKAQQNAKKSIPALVPVGLGAQNSAFNKVYLDTWNRILLQNQPIQSVLNDEGSIMAGLIQQAGAKCWSPDKPSKGPCPVG